MKTDVNGCSTCKPGQEQWEGYYTPVLGKYRVQYDYRSLTGALFSCTARNIQEARAKRDAWLQKIGVIA